MVPEISAHVALMTHHAGGRVAVPLVLVDWPDARWLSEAVFRGLRRALRARPVKRSRWHRWRPRVWATDALRIRFSYRAYTEAWRPDTLRVSILIDGAPGPLVQDAVIHDADQVWFSWKGAYQECGYALVLAATHEHSGAWHLPPTLELGYLITDIDYSEVGDWEHIARETAAAREAARRNPD